MAFGILILSFLIVSFVPFPTHNKNSLNDGSNFALSFSVKLVFSNVGHNFDVTKIALIAHAYFFLGQQEGPAEDLLLRQQLYLQTAVENLLYLMQLLQKLQLREQ